MRNQEGKELLVRMRVIEVSHNGLNLQALAVINGEEQGLVRQGGGLNFWAFEDRSNFSADALRQIDTILDQHARRDGFSL